MAETIWSEGAGGGVGAVVAVVDVPSCVDASHWAEAQVEGSQGVLWLHERASLRKQVAAVCLVEHGPELGVHLEGRSGLVELEARALEQRRNLGADLDAIGVISVGV
ncbi:unnamed protein product, partial [marine sediment metagenome]